MAEDTKKKPARKAKPAADQPEGAAAEAAPKPARKKAAKPAAPAKKAAPSRSAAPRAPREKKVPEKTITVTQIGSPIGRRYDQRATLKGLGLNKRHRSRVLEDTPAVRGMIERVQHLLRVEASG